MAATPLHQWVQYAPAGLEARAVVPEGSACPAISVDGAGVAMAVRAAADARFPVTVCAAAIPAAARSAALAGKPLPLPKKRADRVLLVGDTGCRVTSAGAQDCANAAAWPFAKGSALEASLRPDVVVHLGDFYYREAPCPLNNRGCYGSPYGDNWETWETEFFAPAKPLLESAPFVLVRGNHEECGRGNIGWARLLDPYPFGGGDGCLARGEPFVADIGQQTVVVMDVADAAELRASPSQVEIYRKQFRAVAKLAPRGPVWLAFHRPIWASGVSLFGFVVGDNKTLAEAARNDIPPNVDLLLSGHIHTFQILSFEEDLPIQIVSGNGGDELHLTAPADPKGIVVDGVTVAAGVGTPGVFGFAMLDREAAGWRVTNYDMDGKARHVCVTRARKLECDRLATGSNGPGNP